MMEIGMLWFDDDPQDNLYVKIMKAAGYYQRKYREKANLCFVHPSMLPASDTLTCPIMVQPNSTIRPHNFWIGIAEADEFESLHPPEKSA